MRMTVIRKFTAAFAALALAVTLAPAGAGSAFGGQLAPAGGNFALQGGGEFDISGVPVSGLNPDGTADVDTTISISLEDLKKVDAGFGTLYSAGKLECYWQVADDASYANSSRIPTSTAGGQFSIEVKPEYAGKYLTFYTDCNDDSAYSNNTAPIKVNAFSIHIVSGPEIESVLYGGNPVMKNVYVSISGWGQYYIKNEHNTTTVYKRTVELAVNGAKVGEQTTSEYSATLVFPGVAVPYGQDSTLEVTMHMSIWGQDISSATKSYKIPASTLGENTVTATKISAKQAIVRWTGVSGAGGYRIYQGKKLIKQVNASTLKCTVKRKGAGSAKFRVVPAITANGKTYTGSSNTAKPQANKAKFNVSTSYSSASYMTCPFRITNISLSGKTYTVTGYALNNRIWDMQKYKKLKVGLTVDGKKAFSKTFKNVPVNVKELASKKITLTVKGKAGMDLRNGTLSTTVSQTPKWVYSSGREIK